MADAYDVMSMAKRSGAALQQKEDWEAYQDELTAAASNRSKGGFWSGLANMGIAKLLPILIPGLGAGAGLMSLLAVGGARAGLGYGIGEAVRGLTSADTRAGAFKGTSTGPYGRKGAAFQKRQAEMISKTIGDELAGSRRMRGFTSLASGALADKDAWGDWAQNFGKGAKMDKTWLKGVEDNPWLIEEFDPQELARYKDLTAPSMLEKGFETGKDVLEWGGKAGKTLLELLVPKGYYAPRHRGGR